MGDIILKFNTLDMTTPFIVCYFSNLVYNKIENVLFIF